MRPRHDAVFKRPRWELAMAIYEWIGIALCLAVYGVPFGVGLFVSSWTKAILLAFASFAGLFLSIWSTLGPLFLPLAAQLVTRFEWSALLMLSFAAGTLQAMVVASLGFGAKKLLLWAVHRSQERPEGVAQPNRA
jgi:hypothetical protein